MDSLEVTGVRRGIGNLPPAERPGAGKVINAAVEAMEAKLAEAALEARNPHTVQAGV